MHPRLKKLTHLSEAALAPSLALASSPQDKFQLEDRSGAEAELCYVQCWALLWNAPASPAPIFYGVPLRAEKREDGSRVFTRTRLAARWWTRPGPHVELARAAFLLVLFTRPVNLLASRLASRGVRATPAMRCATPSHLVSIARVSRVSIYGRAPIPSCSSNKPSSSSFYRSIHF